MKDYQCTQSFVDRLNKKPHIYFSKDIGLWCIRKSGFRCDFSLDYKHLCEKAFKFINTKAINN